MALDAVTALKVESLAEGGSQNDTTPTELSPRQDALTAAGLYIQSPAASASDKTVLIDRPAGNLRLTDQSTQRLLSELLTSVPGGLNSHESLRDLAHFLAGQGPGPGFPSGAYCSLNYSGPLLTSRVWWTDSTMSTKIVSQTYAYAAGSPLPQSCTFAIYGPTGQQTRSLTDSYSYTGPLLTGITRTWS